MFLSFGTAELTGPSTRWITSSLTIGDRGVGEVRVLDGALLEVTNTQQFTTVLGNQSGSFGRLVVSGTGTRWIDARAVTIGGSGSGELWIEDGALVVNAGAVLAQSSNGGAGLAVVRGAQTRWQAGGLVVGQEGPAQLRIEEGATVVAAGVQAAPRTGTSGRITLDAGTFAVAGSQSFENRGVVEGDGLLSIPYFNNVQSGVVKVGAGQRLRLTGQLNSPNRVASRSSAASWKSAARSPTAPPVGSLPKAARCDSPAAACSLIPVWPRSSAPATASSATRPITARSPPRVIAS